MYSTVERSEEYNKMINELMTLYPKAMHYNTSSQRFLAYRDDLREEVSEAFRIPPRLMPYNDVDCKLYTNNSRLVEYEFKRKSIDWAIHNPKNKNEILFGCTCIDHKGNVIKPKIEDLTGDIIRCEFNKPMVGKMILEYVYGKYTKRRLVNERDI
jgi:hypothetical protein